MKNNILGMIVLILAIILIFTNIVTYEKWRDADTSSTFWHNSYLSAQQDSKYWQTLYVQYKEDSTLPSGTPSSSGTSVEDRIRRILGAGK